MHAKRRRPNSFPTASIRCRRSRPPAAPKKKAVLNLKGTIDYFIQNTFNYPTLAEAYKIAGPDAWNRMTR